MAFWMISGTGTPDGNDRPRPENMRIVRRPWRRLFSEASGGLGVTARDGIGVTERDTTPFSLLSLDFFEPNFQEDMVVVRDSCGRRRLSAACTEQLDNLIGSLDLYPDFVKVCAGNVQHYVGP